MPLFCYIWFMSLIDLVNPGHLKDFSINYFVSMWSLIKFVKLYLKTNWRSCKFSVVWPMHTCILVQKDNVLLWVQSCQHWKFVYPPSSLFMTQESSACLVLQWCFTLKGLQYFFCLLLSTESGRWVTVKGLGQQCVPMFKDVGTWMPFNLMEHSIHQR